MKFVVAIDKDKTIDEKTAQCFAKNFFEKVYIDGICSAYIYAKEMVGQDIELIRNEKDRILLITSIMDNIFD